MCKMVFKNFGMTIAEAYNCILSYIPSEFLSKCIDFLSFKNFEHLGEWWQVPNTSMTTFDFFKIGCPIKKQPLKVASISVNESKWAALISLNKFEQP